MSKSIFVSRINQIDAVQLDQEIYKVLRTQVNEITKYFAPGKIVKWRPEIDVLVKYFIWNFSLKTNSSTFGQRLLNLSYRNLDRRKAIVLFALMAVPEYLRDRLINENFILSKFARLSSYKRSKYRSYIEHIDNFCHLLNFIWTFFFLHLGNQPLFIEKLLNIHNQSSTMNKPRSIGYSYMTRELLWHGLIELFTISLPMIDLRLFQKFWNRLWIPKKNEKKIVISYRLNKTSLCGYCNESPILPKWAGCSHVFCYYCLEALFIMVDPYHCPVCNEELFSSNMKS
ncbi:peroxisome biogenesis factor 2 [Phymastichus coffea]|uniref:peroxisome biogenesis factor 2 n=1 Tax=Phymastichus coffea TaxID=108790 RepID=UPI00273AB42A|nr:peroxisome biogenesis factor 2 [Phymastichus coffea]